ncbi:MAG: glycine--tRNA ligase [Chthoniobacteraceae bacterium]
MSQPKETPLMEKIVSLCKRRGFIFQSSEIYGGINGFWDYGPLGAELKRNLRDTWWRAMTRDREDVVGLDATIIMHPAIWKASGHVDTFADLMRECTVTNKRVRADHVEPQSGTVLKFSGAESPNGWRLDRVLTVLMKKAEHIESFRKRVKQMIAQNAGSAAGNADELVLRDEEKIDVVEGSVDFHPDSGGLLGEARPFNLMLKTYVGPTASEADVAYLRPETAQAIFAQFKNVVDSSRQKVPFGICQIGKAFRNEVTPRNYTFRSREFEQMELEFFITPDEAIRILHGSVAQWSEGADLSAPQPNWGWEMWHHYWEKERVSYYASIGLSADLIDYHRQQPDELAHYARACVDILFKFPFGTEELEGIAARSDFDLTQHQTHSGKSQEIFDEELRTAAGKLDDAAKAAFVSSVQEEWSARAAKNNKPADEALAAAKEFCEKLFKGLYVPHVIEPSAGLDRLALAVLAAAYHEEEKADVNGKIERRTVLRFHPRVAPVKVGIFPLLKNKSELVAIARDVYNTLKRQMNCFYDETGNIGRRYARQDEAGTPFGVTIDFETLGEKGDELKDTVTLRHRDDGRQERVKISELLAYLLPKVS